MALSVLDVLALSVHTFTFLLGLPANLLVLFVYARRARRRGATPNAVYALNLCAANLTLTAWLPVPVLDTLQGAWRLPAAVCPLYSFFRFLSLNCSCLLLSALSVARYLCAAFPIAYKRYRRARISCAVAACAWVLVGAHLSVSLVAEGGASFVGSKDNASACYEHFSATQLRVLVPLRVEMAVTLFLVPLLVTSFCTLRCVTLVRRSQLPPAGKRRVLQVALSTLAVFVVCYAPYNASHVVGFAQGTSVTWRPYAMLSSACNVFLEPLLMLMLYPPRSVLACLCRKLPVPKPMSGLTNLQALPTLSQQDKPPK